MDYRLSVSLVVVKRRGYEDEQVLVVTSRKWGGFSLPGGKVDPGESLEEAARRELKEETGLDATKLVNLGAEEHEPVANDPDRNRWLCMCYFAEVGDQEPKQNEEGTIPSWVSPRAIADESLYRDFTRRILTKARVKWDPTIKLLLCPEGYFDRVESFMTFEERDAYAFGFGDGGNSYGAGAALTIPWEVLDDPKWFEDEFGGEHSSMRESLEDLRKQAGWQPPTEG